MNKVNVKLISKLSNPRIKRITFTAILTAFLAAGITTLELTSPLMAGILSGAAAYLIGLWIFLSANERKEIYILSVTLFREHSDFVLRNVMLLTLAVYCFSTTEKPADADIDLLQQLVGLFTLFLIVLYSVYISMREAIVNGEIIFCRKHLLDRIILGTVVCSLIVWSIGKYGIEIKEWTISSPNELVVLLLSFLISFFVLKLSFTAPDFDPNIEKISPPSMSNAILLPKLSYRDIKYIAAHEAGHALTYAALGNLPPDLKIIIDDSTGPRDPCGYITDVICNHRLSERSFIEWKMLVLLAGKYGESFTFGENTLGSGNDHQRWLNLAKTYLSNHFDGIFYTDPQSKFEQELNEDKLKKLQLGQNAILRVLFTNNTQIFKLLTDKLLEKREMSKDDLTPYLNQVKLPHDFPIPGIN